MTAPVLGLKNVDKIKIVAKTIVMFLVFFIFTSLIIFRNCTIKRSSLSSSLHTQYFTLIKRKRTEFGHFLGGIFALKCPQAEAWLLKNHASA